MALVSSRATACHPISPQLCGNYKENDETRVVRGAKGEFVPCLLKHNHLTVLNLPYLLTDNIVVPLSCRPAQDM